MADTNKNLKNSVFIIIAIVVFIVAFIFVYNGYQKEGEKRSVFIETPTNNPDHIDIFAYIVSIDPIKGDMVVRMSFEPMGALANDRGFLNEEVELFINSVTGKQQYIFEKNKIINPIEVTLNLFDGLVSDYPLDKHKAELFIATSTKIKMNGNPQETEDIALDNVLNFSGSVSGYKITAALDEESSESYTILNIDIARAGSVTFFSFFVIVVMWILIIMLMALIYTILVNGRKIEIAMFTFSSAMIFAFPAFRNIMPLAPPIGAFPDYIAFFWAEAAAAITLIVLILTWIIRKQS